MEWDTSRATAAIVRLTAALSRICSPASAGVGMYIKGPFCGQVESGDGTPDLASMYAVALALHQLSGHPVRLADLLPGSSKDRRLTPTWHVSRCASSDSFWS